MHRKNPLKSPSCSTRRSTGLKSEVSALSDQHRHVIKNDMLLMMINNITQYNTTLLLMHFVEKIKNERIVGFVFRFLLLLTII